MDNLSFITIEDKPVYFQNITDCTISGDQYTITYIDDKGIETKTLVSEENYFRALNAIMPDMVNHPSHYTNSKVECIDVMLDIYGKEQVQSFCLCNAFKYLFRCEHKDNKIEDIKKANWYLNKYIKLEDGN